MAEDQRIKKENERKIRKDLENKVKKEKEKEEWRKNPSTR